MRETTILDLMVAGHAVPTPCDRAGAGSDVLLLPALSTISSRVEMAELADRLATDHRCLTPDWPGFGAHPRARLPLTPDTLHAFLDALLAAAPGPYAIGIAAGHAAAYLVAAARRHPKAFARLVLVAPTWRGPLPTVMGPARQRLFTAIRRAVEAPLLGDALYGLNIRPKVIGRMMRAHVYADAGHVTDALVADKTAITRQRGARFGTAAFVTGGLDPVPTRDAFHGLFSDGLPPIRVLRPSHAPRRSAAEMDALVASARVEGRPVPGALSPHEEYPTETAAAIRAA